MDINDLSNIQYNQYKNLQIFAEKWRNMTIKNKILSEEEFTKNLQFNSYVHYECIQNTTGKNIIIYLLAKTNKSINTQDVRKIFNKIKIVCDVILVSEYIITIDLNKLLSTMKHIHNIHCYKHENFNLIIPDCILSGKHRIMNKIEINQLVNEDLFTTIANLPKIREDDPQCIWIGAKIGDIIEIVSPSFITHLFRTYKVVVPRLGKNIYIQNIIEKENKNNNSFIEEDENKNEDLDNDLIEEQIDDIVDEQTEDIVDEQTEEPYED
jgi:DNA-directed RNA polymerase subunit H (RpoH/RPB5)